jgi:hypothetical protein
MLVHTLVVLSGDNRLPPFVAHGFAGNEAPLVVGGGLADIGQVEGAPPLAEAEVEAAPLAAPVPAPAEEPPPKRQRPPPDGWLTFELGAHGKIVYDMRNRSFGAHCPLHQGCRLNRTSEAGAREHQGRPLGQLAQWLLMANQTGSYAEHSALKRDGDRLSYPRRLAGRAWLAQQPGTAQLFELERPRRPDEREEPVGLAG